MAQTSARLSLQGMLDFVPKSRRPLAAVFEAITNSLEAIAQRQKGSAKSDPGLVKVQLYFTGLDEETRKLQRIEVIDNGIGFDDVNYERFETFLDRTKGFNNRGSGRVQYLHFANQIEVTSCFGAGDAIRKRHFYCTPSKFITESTIEPAPKASIGTTLVFTELALGKEPQEYFETLTLDELGNALKSHFLLWLHLARVQHPKLSPSIEFALYKNGKEEGRRKLNAADIPTPETGQVSVPYLKLRDPHASTIEWQRQIGHSETLKWAHFKLADSELPENGVLLCSKGVVVERVPFEGLKKGESVEGHRYLTAFYGDALDRAENVNHTVDRFTLPRRGETEKVIREKGALFDDPEQPILFIDEIESAVENALPNIYKDLIARKEEQARDVDAIAAAHGIDAETVRATKISLSDGETQITEKLFKQQAEALAKRSLKIKRLFEQLEDLDPADENYQTELLTRTDELLCLIPEQNKQELSRYVIRRQMVAKVLGMILDKSLVVAKPAAKLRKERKDKEGLVHDLLIKRRGSTSEGPNDLWVLNEEFLHFEGFSDVPFERMTDKRGVKLLREISDADLDQYGLRNKTLRRPDIFLFVDEGQCILVELKAPDVDLSDHLTQLEKYCNLIANFAVTPIRRFYCYLIGEVVSPIDIGGRYRQDMHGDWINRSDYKIMRYEKDRQDEEIGEAHFEIIKLSSIHLRALRRNKSFADRLGISDEVLK